MGAPDAARPPARLMAKLTSLLQNPDRPQESTEIPAAAGTAEYVGSGTTKLRSANVLLQKSARFSRPPGSFLA